LKGLKGVVTGGQVDGLDAHSYVHSLLTVAPIWRLPLPLQFDRSTGQSVKPVADPCAAAPQSLAQVPKLKVRLGGGSLRLHLVKN